VLDSKIRPFDASGRAPGTGLGRPSTAEAGAEGGNSLELGRVLEARRADLDASFDAGEDGVALGRRNSHALDGLVRLVYRHVVPPPPDGLALVAVGSHGRGAVARYSDADLRIVVPPRAQEGLEGVLDTAVAAFVDGLLYPLWDAGIAVGHQVIGQAELLELAQHDLTAATALLDMRPLEGSRETFQALLTRAYEGIFAEEGLRDFVDRLDAETEARHERFGGSLYLLEPDVKSAAGGLRDLDGARWAARARFGVGEGEASVSPWAELVRLGVLVAREEAEISRAEEFLWRVRNRLHVHAGRRSDRLTFDEQELIALDMGYGGKEGHRGAAAEAFMQDYYNSARSVTRARERIFERARVRRRAQAPLSSRARPDLGPGVFLLEDAVTLSGSEELARDPALALRVYLAAVREQCGVHDYARSAVARQAADPAWCARLRESPEAQAAFVALVGTVAEVKMRRGSVLGELHDAGLLLAMIPEFLPVTGRVHHDVYHVYTVDVHSVASVDCLRALLRGQMAHDQPLASGLAAEVARTRPLFLATLLHDVGKGYPDASGSRKNHSKSGAEFCDVILPRLGLPPEEVATARLLVEQHLAMYLAATRRDTSDRATIEEFCRPLAGRETLRALYLLTIADLTTTSPTAMTSWKARMLEELYLAADAYLAETREAKGEERGGRAAHLADEAKRLWAEAGLLGRGDLATFLASMPERYVASRDASAVVAHARVSLERGGRPAHAAIVPSSQSAFAELCVVAEDRPGLLASIAAVITASRLEVFAAEVYSRTLSDGRSEAVDLFWLRDRVDGKAGVERRLPSLVRDLADVCSGRVSGRELLAARTGTSSTWRERPSPAIPTEVVVDDRASPGHTVVEVFAKDRPGLLHALAETLHALGLSIALSKINTEGARVADVFYVTEGGGQKVRGGERLRQIKDEIARAVEGL
jgi:[protein-PII] uridylyltransferase